MADVSSPATRLGTKANRQTAPAPAGGAVAVDPVAIVRSKRHVGALVLAVIVGTPVSAIAYGFLALFAAI